MSSIGRYEAIRYVAKQLETKDFHGRSDGKLESEAHYEREAEKQINRMTNLELLDLIGELSS